MTSTSSADWFARPTVVAVLRVAHAAFFLTASAYCFLAYSPFAYDQFIKPNHAPALTDFVMLSQWYFWAVLLMTLLTLMPQLRGGRGQRAAVAYLAIFAVVGVVVFFRPPLRTIGDSQRAFVIGLLALVSPVWLAVVDHVSLRPARLRETPPSRALRASIWSALIIWAMYALAVPLRLRQTTGIALTRGALATAFGSSLIVGLYCFMALFLALAAIGAVARLLRGASAIEYWSFIALLGTCAALVMYFLVCASITFTGWDAAVASAALGGTIAVVWADLARLRSRQSPVASHQSGVDSHQSESPVAIDSLALFSAPIAGVRSRRVAAAVLIAMPVVAYLLVDTVSHFDWNFLLQKLTVLMVWVVTFSAVYASTRSVKAFALQRSLVVAPALAFALYHAFVWVEPRAVLDRYAAVDPSFRLIRDARKARSAETAEYYALLRSHTLLPARDIPPLDVEFVGRLDSTPARKPDIFLWVIDSLRRDYVSPYNPRVTFTPEIGKLAADSLVFERAFTRYAGTGLAVPSIWAGGMMPHSLLQPEFGRRNALLKLLSANGYLRIMDVDHIMLDLLPPSGDFIQLDKGKTTVQFDVCNTVDELQMHLDATDRSRPVFFYSLPQNVHISIASHRKVPDGESYPGFFAPVASSILRIDACIGRFVDYLKRTGRYDNSIIILTSDHGDSLGEEGRWGHGSFIVPEVMRIPLIVHLPSSLASRVSVDLSAVTFSSDLTPSLYALLGYEPADRGPMFGRSVFGGVDARSASRRRGDFLLASSYGTVYAALRHNGRRLYVVDAIDGRDNAFDVSNDDVGVRVDLTDAMISENRRLIAQQLAELARENHYSHP